MRIISILVLALFAASPALAEQIACDARVAGGQIYTVDLDTDTGALAVETAGGYSYKGIASKSVSARNGNQLYFLPLSFVSGMEVEIEAGGQQRIAFCLQANECYLCRRVPTENNSKR